jgi:hypothetical protein
MIGAYIVFAFVVVILITAFILKLKRPSHFKDSDKSKNNTSGKADKL